jgi:O-antigen ligase
MHNELRELYDRKRAEVSNNIVAFIGIGALLGYAFFWLLYLPWAKVAETLLVLVSVYVLFRRPANLTRVVRQPVGLLLLVWLLLAVVNAFVNMEYFKGYMVIQLHEVRHYTKIFLFIILAWWMSGFPRIVFLTLFLASVGFLLGPLVAGYDYAHEIQIFKAGRRITLGYWNWEHVSVYAGFTLLFFSVFYRRIRDVLPNHKWLGTALVVVGILYSMVVVYGANTRATYLGLGIAVLAWGGYQIYRLYIGKPLINRKQIVTIGAIFVGIVVVFASLGFNPFSKVVQRIDAEQDVIDQLASGELDNIRMSSLGKRIYTWRYAFHKLKKHPWIGLGPRTREQILAEPQVNKAIRRQGTGHFHNSYIELLLAYGILGALIFVALVSHIVYGVVQARKQGLIPDDIFNFLLLFSVYWFCVNLVESYVIYTTGFFINAIVGGAAYTFYLKFRIGYQNEATAASH